MDEIDVEAAAEEAKRLLDNMPRRGKTFQDLTNREDVDGFLDRVDEV